jgi:hypothetical protein
MADASATFSHPVPDMLRVPGSGLYLGSRTPMLVSMSTTSGLSRTSASSALRSSEAEISWQHVRHMDRSQNYEGDMPKAKGRAGSAKGGRTRGVMSFNPPPNSCCIRVMVCRPPMPPIKGSMRQKRENGNCSCETPIWDDCMPPPRLLTWA